MPFVMDRAEVRRRAEAIVKAIDAGEKQDDVIWDLMAGLYHTEFWVGPTPWGDAKTPRQSCIASAERGASVMR